MAESYADIHHFPVIDEKCVDEDGDPMFGWYYQIMESPNKPSSEMIGPYHGRSECEQAALDEWSEMPA